MNELTLTEVADGLRKKKFSSVELTNAMFNRINKINPIINSYVTLFEDEALDQAKKADETLNERSSLVHGVPMSLKDIFNTKGGRTTCCSNIIKDFVPPYDSTVVNKLRKNGAVFLGKNNMDEFACGSSTEHSCFGVTKNPWDSERVAGGSSGGSTATVAADMAYYSLGTDTGGSIRQPASLCSVVGLKVTYGRVSRSGVTSLASSWDTIGSITKTVRDNAVVLNEIAGLDKRDSTTSPFDVPDYTKNLGKGVKGLKIGVPKEYFSGGIDNEVLKIVNTAINEFKKMGAQIIDVSLPYSKYAAAVYYVSMSAELSANLARFDGIRFGSSVDEDEAKDLVDYYLKVRTKGFGDEVKRRIMIGAYVLSAGYNDAYYKKAQKVRTLIIKDFERVFNDVDVLVAPVSPIPAFKIGEKSNDPLSMYLADIFTIPINAAGIPALSVPCGFTNNGLPVGLQIIGSQFTEDLLFKVGAAYEQTTEFHKRKPEL